MPDAIWLGEVFITDTNDNDFYDPKVDLVTDLSGKSLSPKEASQKLKKVLKTVGAKEWKDLSLFGTQEYLVSFREAGRLSQLGEVDEVEDLLTQAQDAAANLTFPFNQKKADRLRQEVRIQAIDNAMTEALDDEQGDDWKSVFETLEEIELWDLELQGNFGTQAKYDVKEYERLLNASYQNLFDEAKINISIASSKGQISWTKQLMTDMSDYAYLAKKQFGLDFGVTQKETDDWMKEAYNQGIPDLFNRIFDLAQKGQVQTIKRFMPLLKNYLAEADQNYGLTFQYTPKMLENVYETALIEGIEDNFKLAEEAAQNGERDRAEKLLQLTLEYVDEYNQIYPKKKPLDFDSARAADILSCAWNSKNCP